MPTARRSLLAAALIALPALWSLPAAAQDASWPTKPVMMVIPYPAGGNSDAIGQILLTVSQYPDYVGPEAFARQVREDSQAFKELIVQSNIRVE